MDKLQRFLKSFTLSAGVSLLMASAALSDDIDVYVGSGSTTAGDTLVVFTLDYRPDIVASTVCTNGECDELFKEVGMFEDENGDGEHDGSISFLELLTAALRKVLGEINSPDIKVALMAPHEHSIKGNSSCVGYQGSTGPECSNGAYVLAGFKPTDDSTEMEKFYNKLESVPFKDDNANITGNWDHDYQLKELLFEMFRFVTGEDVYNNENGLEDYDSDDTYNIDHELDTINTEPHNEDPDNSSTLVAELAWDPEALVPNTKTYVDSLDAAGHCSSVFSVNLTAGKATKDDDSDAAIEASFANGGMGLNLAGGNFDSRIQVLEFLANNDLDDSLTGTQNIISYFVSKESGGSGGTGARSDDWAAAGGTESALIATENPDELVATLSSLFNEILSVSTTFVAASVPANVFNRAETLNEVFLAIFEPDENKAPFWTGNVKKLTTTTIEETISCEDADGDGIEQADECETEERKILVDVLEADKENPESAISPLDGRIRPGALTYWTRTGSDNEYLPAPTTEEDEQEFEEGTDGRKVARGAAGQVKPGYLPEDGYSPGETNDNTSATTISGPRTVFTEPDDTADGLPSDALVDLDAESLSDTTATELLTDSRAYPGSNLTYGDYLFRTVMEDDSCSCDDYSDATATQQETAQIRVSNLIRFARGWDVGLDTTLSTTLSTAGKRPWWQSDPLHSRPLALNYGARSGYTSDRPDIRVIVAGNDGQIQMIRDGRKSDGTEDGVEAWSFLPREFVPLQKRLLEGDIGSYIPGEPDDPDGHEPLHPYAMDGAPTALVVDNDLDGTIETGDGDNVYLFFGQRRGGKRYYALDVSDPDQPKFLWSIGKGDADGEFAELGQSWSLMRAGLMEVEESGVVKNRAVLIFSGGYNGDDEGDGTDNDGDGFDIADDLGKDSRVANDGDETIGLDDDEGNALFIVNAITGELIWKAVGPPTADSTKFYDSGELSLEHPDMVDSVPSSPTIVDSDADGFIDRVYFPDTGGNVWRMDAAGPDRSTWTVNKLFESGRHYQADGDHDRRFFNAPDVVFASDDNGDFDAVVLASGDRARPLGTEVENWIYMIKDRNTTSGAPSGTPLTHADLADLTDNCLQDDSVTCPSSVETNITNGWKVQMEQCEAGGTNDHCGEKSLASPLTIEGTVFLTTYLPVLPDSDTSDSDPETCGTKEGGGLFYALDLQNAGGVLDFNPNNNTDGEETPERFDNLASPGIPPEVVAISPDEVLRPDLKIQKTKGRESSDTFWYERKFE